MKPNTRRDFLKLAATTASLPLLKASLAASPDRPEGKVEVWATYGEKRFASLAPLTWTDATKSAGDTVVLDFADQHQDVLGFGGAFTDSACFMFNQLPEGLREKLFQELFSPSEMGLNVCRTCIGASDYSVRPYSYDESDQPDPSLEKFSIDYDKGYILPILRLARKTNPALFLFSSPWSPPGWMKANNSMLGGSMRKRHYASYAQYFVKFLRAYAAESVTINAVTVQNEVDTDQDGRMPACLWGQEYEIEFVKGHLGPALRKSNLDTRIWVLDHNYNLWGRALGELGDPEVYQYVDGIAWHGYAGDPSAMSRVKAAYPEKHMYWTEGGPDITAPDYLTDWAKWAGTFADILQNRARAITTWNLALDEKGNPNIGPFPCGGVVTINSTTKEITRSGQYWALAHYSKLIKPGAKVCTSTGPAKNLGHVAVSNPNGQRVVVLSNHGQECTVGVHLANRGLEVRMPKDSVFTLAWG